MTNNAELQIIDQREVLGKGFRVYGDLENPLFLAKDVAEWIEYCETGKGNLDVSSMLQIIDETEKVKITTTTNCRTGDGSKHTGFRPPTTQWFITEDGLYEILMQSRKPIAKALKKEVKIILKTIRKHGEENKSSNNYNVADNRGLQVFNYTGNNVRIVFNDNEPWFVAKDVCEILEIGNTSQALSRLDEDEKADIILNDSSQNRTFSIISESGLYSLILSSRKPESKAFKRWVTHEIIPSIRKHGVYATEDTIDKMLNDPDFAIKTFTKLKEEREARKLAEQKIEKLEEVVSTKQITIDLLTKQLIRIADRKLLNSLVRDRGGCVGYQEAYRSLYSVFLTRCSIDVYRRASYRDCSKIDCIDKNEWSKVMPVTVAWYLENGGSQTYLQELVKGKVEVNAVSQQ